jgi:predicted dehydrogenase
MGASAPFSRLWYAGPLAGIETGKEIAMTGNFRWGILGTGTIAKQFARGLKAVPDGTLAAVGSRAQDTADRFADEFGVPRRHASYKALAEDPDLDAIYIATPHSLHCENTLSCLRAGKAVLCEKPFAINREEAQKMAAAAREEKRFLMEAMWTRFLPALVQTRQWIAAGAIGEVRMVQSDFGFRADINGEHRLFNPACGGGGLLDVGVYAVSMVSMLFGGRPEAIRTLADIGETGVDEQAAAILGYAGGRLGIISTGVRTTTPQETWIMGTEGMIHLPAPFWRVKRARLLPAGGKPVEADLPFAGNGYNCEAEEVQRCAREGRIESEIMPLDESLVIMETLDRIRAEWGFKYPME